MPTTDDARPRPVPSNVLEQSANALEGDLEFRMHGIGEHHYMSALGDPPLELGSSDLHPFIAGPPVIPTHRLALLNWSDMSRRHAKLLWFLALPFTLVNVAGTMGHSRQTDRRTLPSWSCISACCLPR